MSNELITKENNERVKAFFASLDRLASLMERMNQATLFVNLLFEERKGRNFQKTQARCFRFILGIDLCEQDE